MNTFRDNDLCGNIALINVLKPFFDIIPIEISALTGYTRSCLLILLFFFFLISPKAGGEGCTVPGSTAIPGRCVEWMEQAPIPTSCSKNSLNILS